MCKDFSPEEMELIRKQFFPASGTPTEWQTCLAVARELGLNPILKEIHFMARRQRRGERWVSRVDPLVGRDGFLSIAHRTGHLAGMESTARVCPVPRLEAEGWDSPLDLVAECRVWRKDTVQPFVVTVSFGEYVQKGSDGHPTRFWAEKPETMLKKVAESQALRKAFNIHGVYAPEELGIGTEAAGDIVVEPDDSALTTGPERKRSDAGTVPPSSAQEAPLLAILAACQAKGLAVERRESTLIARSYAQRDFLKSQGFRWDGQQRCWIYALHNQAA